MQTSLEKRKKRRKRLRPYRDYIGELFLGSNGSVIEISSRL
jgi:hypothetical protein